MRSSADKVALAQIFLRVFRVPLIIIIIPPSLLIRSHIYHQYYKSSQLTLSLNNAIKMIPACFHHF